MNAIDPDGKALIRNTNVMMTDSGSGSKTSSYVRAGDSVSGDSHVHEEQVEHEDEPEVGDTTLIENYDNSETEETYIYSQVYDERTYARDYGLSTMGTNGCEIVAIYNAMISLGDPQTLDSIVDWGLGHSLWLLGFFGTSYWKIGDYFKEMGYEVETEEFVTTESLQLIVNKYDAVIFSYWTDPVFLFIGGIHTVFIEGNASDGYLVYNHRNSTSSAGKYDFSEKECQLNRLIIAYGINRK